MKNKIILSVFAIVLTMCYASCDDVVSTNLDGRAVVINSPANNFKSKSYSIQFWWEELEGAEKYNIQIVTPSFAAVQHLLVDSTISGTKFLQTLQPGTFQWRLRAVNSTSATPYVVYNLTIDSSLNLATEIVLLNAPTNNSYVNSLTQNLSWFVMPNATEYLFRITNTSDVSIGSIESVLTNTITYTFPTEGTFKWKVSAANNQSSSSYSERTITIDTTKPNIPVITFVPVNDSTSLNPVPLSWNSVEANASYYLQISTDITFTSVVKDTTTSDLTYNFHNPVKNTYYYWRLRAIDIATNEGTYSNKRRFKVFP